MTTEDKEGRIFVLSEKEYTAAIAQARRAVLEEVEKYIAAEELTPLMRDQIIRWLRAQAEKETV